MGWRGLLVLFACLVGTLRALRGKYASLESFTRENSAGSLDSCFRSLNWSPDNYGAIMLLVGDCRMNLNQYYPIMCERLDWQAFLPFYSSLRSLEDNSLVELVLSPSCWMRSPDARQISDYLLKDGFYCGAVVGVVDEMGEIEEIGENVLFSLTTITDPRASTVVCDAVIEGRLSPISLEVMNLPAQISQNCLEVLSAPHESIERELGRQIASVPIGSLANLLNRIFNSGIQDSIVTRKAIVDRVCGETSENALAKAYGVYIECESTFEWEKFHAEYSQAAQAGLIEPAFQPANLQLWIHGATMEADDDSELFEGLLERIMKVLEGLDPRWNFAKADVSSVQALLLCMLNPPSLAAYQRLGRAIGLDYDAFMQRIVPAAYPSPLEIYHFPWSWRLQYYQHNFVHPSASTRWGTNLEALRSSLQRMKKNPDMICSADGQMFRPLPHACSAKVTKVMHRLWLTKLFDERAPLRLDPRYCEVLYDWRPNPSWDGKGEEPWKAHDLNRHRDVFMKLFRVKNLEFLLVGGAPSLCQFLSE